jgi:hypothetical protein
MLRRLFKLRSILTVGSSAREYRLQAESTLHDSFPTLNIRAIPKAPAQSWMAKETGSYRSLYTCSGDDSLVFDQCTCPPHEMIMRIIR